MKVYKVICPSCKAELNIEKSKEYVKCEYCGSKVFLEDGTKKVEVTKNINKSTKDETKIKEIESKERIKLKQMELEEERKMKIAKIVIISIIGISVLFFSIKLISKAYESINDWYEERQLNKERESQSQIPVSAEEAKEIHYTELVERLKNAGFTNIKTMPIEDLVFGVLTKDGEVENITINGNSSFYKGEWFEKNSKILITYHTFKDKKDK